MNTTELLKEFYDTRNPKFIASQYWDDKNKRKREYWSSDKDTGPLSFEFVTMWKDIIPKKFDFVPIQFYNKRIKLGEYDIIIQYKHEAPKRCDNYGNDLSRGYRREAYSQYKFLNIILCFHGIYVSLARYREYYIVSADFCTPAQTNYRQSFKDQKTPYMMREYSYEQEFDYYENAQKIIDSIGLDCILVDSDIKHQEWYNLDNKKTLKDYSQEQVDFNWFLSQDIGTGDGIFKPEKANIDKVWIPYVPPKDLLQKAGVTIVQLRANCHFDVSRAFDMKGILLKAPKSVIKAYGLEKFCNDVEIVKKIKEEEEQAQRDYDLLEYNDKFTLMQHGKVIFEDTPKWEIITYLEVHEAEEIEPQIIKNMQPVFDHFKDIDKLYVGTWGQHWEYEMRGHRMDYTSDTRNMNMELMDAETHRELYELFEDNMCYDFDDKTIEIKYGWPEMSYNRIVVERKPKGKLKIFVETYND